MSCRKGCCRHLRDRRIGRDICDAKPDVISNMKLSYSVIVCVLAIQISKLWTCHLRNLDPVELQSADFDNYFFDGGRLAEIKCLIIK